MARLTLALLVLGLQGGEAQAYCWARPAPASIERLRAQVGAQPHKVIVAIQQELKALQDGRLNPERGAWLYSVLAGAHYDLNEAEGVQQAARKGLALAKSRQAPSYRDLQLALANSATSTEDMRAAIIAYSTMLRGSADIDEQACILNARGRTYDILNESSKALSDLTNGYVLSSRASRKNLRAENAAALADVVSYRQMMEMAQPLYEEAQRWYQENGQDFQAAIVAVRMSLAHYWADEPAKSVAAAQWVLANSERVDMPSAIMTVVHSNLCRAYVQLGQLALAQRHCDRSNDLRSQAEPLLASHLKAKAELALAKGQPREALAFLEQVRKINLGNPFPEEIHTKAKALAALGDSAGAYAAMEASAKARDEQDKADRAFQAEAFQTRMTALENEAQRIGLDRDLKAARERERAQDQKLIIIAVAGSVIVLLLIGVLALRHRHRQRVLTLAEEKARVADEKILFLARISHEIRAPIGSMTLLASALRRQKRLPEEQRRYLSRLDEDGQRVTRMLSEMLEFSKLEAGVLSLSPSTFLLADLIEEVVADHRESALNRNLSLLWSIDADVPSEMQADKMRLQQILDNLFANAIRFTDEGQVDLRISRADRPGNLEFTVRDTGIGIPADQIAALFQAWSQVDAPAHRRGGTGLGLLICNTLVDKMGGRIRAERRGSGGTMICFELPSRAAIERSVSGAA
ncbi:signal transduction histidine kinase [Sphingobium sp. B11D3B]|uniref:sensor histidine kinase n=1 Tax=Sphingobium sp. B11D3B TaxID=2940575 RepID=UPI002226DE86|nr:ATP-binding protein [Sphingobium sp. B11D3B]MCW2387180.1 signal transduction histidine kinase [Sphingobium sp. B11D3B]